MNTNKIHELIMILLGNFIVACSVSFFILPNNILTGGVAGVAVALHPILPVDTVLMIDVKTEEIVQEALSDDEPAIVEMISSPATEFVPIIKSRMGKDGKMISSKLEDLYPFLPEEEQNDNMIVD